jgi:hypothetical protein
MMLEYQLAQVVMKWIGVAYLNVERCDVLDLTHARDSLLDLVRQGGGGEDCERSGLHAHDCASSADFDKTEARKGHGKGGDGLRNNIPNHHDLCRIKWYVGSHIEKFICV